jgi:tripartite-type tricarboxylate transporter receptor subunit TctC
MRTNSDWFSGLMALLCLIATSSGHSSAADYPFKPVRLIVPFSAGSVTDVQARIVAQKVSQRLGQPVVTDNRAGAEGRIGVELVAKAPADGYTVGMGTLGTLVISPLVYSKLAYDSVASFAPISLLTTAPYLLVVHPAVPGATLKEFVDHAKSKPGQVNHGGSNVFVRLALEMFNGAAGTKILHVPYQGGNLAVIDLIAGRTQVMIEAPAAFRQGLQSGKLRALAVADSKRYAQLPTVPTAAEAGFSGFEAKGWFGLLAPKATPPAVVRLWNSEVNQALAQKDVRDTFSDQGFDPAGGTVEQFAAHMGTERVKWSRVVAASGIKLD